MALLNGVRVVSPATGNGSVMVLGDPVEGFVSIAEAGGVDGMELSYVIEANYQNGVAIMREFGKGVWDQTNNILDRTTVLMSVDDAGTVSTNRLSLIGDSQVIITPLEHDFPGQVAVYPFAFTGDGVTAVFDLGRAIQDAAHVRWFEDGIWQQPGVHFSVAGTSVTRTSPPADGAQIYGIHADPTLEQVVAGAYRGNNGTKANNIGDIFRVHANTLNSNVTIAATENAMCAGPLTVADGVVLTVEGSLAIV